MTTVTPIFKHKMKCFLSRIATPDSADLALLNLSTLSQHYPLKPQQKNVLNGGYDGLDARTFGLPFPAGNKIDRDLPDRHPRPVGFDQPLRVGKGTLGLVPDRLNPLRWIKCYILEIRQVDSKKKPY